MPKSGSSEHPSESYRANYLGIRLFLMANPGLHIIYANKNLKTKRSDKERIHKCACLSRPVWVEIL